MPKPLRQPIALAALGSLGIHGLLWAILPILPLASKPSAVQQPPTVGLVELTPAEQGRLPQLTQSPPANKQLSDSQLRLPESSVPPPLPPESSVLPPLPPPLPPESSVLPPLPPLPYTDSSAPPNVIYPPISNFKPGRVAPPPPPSSLLSPSTLPKQPQDTKPSPLLSNPSKITEPESQQREPLPPPPPFSPPANTGLPRLDIKQAAPVTPPPATALNPVPQRNSNQSQNQQTAVANPEINSATTPIQPENSSDRRRQELIADLEKYRERNINRQELLADLEKYRAQSEQTTTATPQRERPPTTREQQLAWQRPTSTTPAELPDNNSTSSMAAERNAQIADYAAWRREIQQYQPEAARQLLATIGICQKQFDGSTTKAEVVVNPQGKIAEGPKIVGQVAPSVEQDTERFLRNYRFSKTEKFTIYPFGITYKYNPSSCSEANLKPATAQTDKHQLAPENLNSNSQPRSASQRPIKRRLRRSHQPARSYLRDNINSQL
ncbi:MAG: hypothetical protein JO235_15115 [Chroococcidiopsidaceae cyanobacterium CP_BM_RX_35]|nr:hypothetical protein [Chroococcidiopsidaceae cyanobacterium CP_BM_RX_35]